MATCKIKEVIPLSSDTINPTIGKYQFRRRVNRLLCFGFLLSIRFFLSRQIANKNPVSAYFENGDILPDGAKSFHCCYAENTNDGSRLALATSDANVYYGKIDQGFATDLQRTFIALRNKTTNKVMCCERDIVNC